jgi:hypothetical protein
MMPDDGIQQLERGGFDAILLGTVGEIPLESRSRKTSGCL